MPERILFTALFLLGCIIGSFLNVCIVRIPKKLSIAFPGSHCPACEKPIPFYYNIPLISYIILGGRCRYCRTPISFRYFFVELLTPVIMLLIFFYFGLSWEFLLAFVFSAALIVITFIDLDLQIIPDVISLPGIPLCFLCSFVVSWIDPAGSLLGIAVGGGVLYIFAAAYKLLTKKDGMGGGDIKLLAMIGAFLGWKGALASLVLGSFAGSIVGLAVIILKGGRLSI